MVPSRATSTAVTAGHLLMDGGSAPQSRVVRYGYGRSFRGEPASCATAGPAIAAARTSAIDPLALRMRTSIHSARRSNQRRSATWTRRGWARFGAGAASIVDVRIAVNTGRKFLYPITVRGRIPALIQGFLFVGK